MRLSVPNEVYEMSRWEGRSVGESSEFQIDRVSATKEISKKQLEEDDIPGGLIIDR